MLRIGITGCIGSGKSTVARMFETLGVPVYLADQRAKDIMVEDAELIQSIKAAFGSESYLDDKSLNRQHLSGIVFQHPEQLTVLNALVHPAVFRDFETWCSKQTTSYIVKEAALMFESNSYQHLHEVIVVTAPEEIRIARTMQRDGITRDAVLSRMKNQFSEAEKRARSQYEIVNDEVQMMIPQVLKLHERFLVRGF